MFTDACPSGWGVVIFEGASLEITGGSYDAQFITDCGQFSIVERIAILEARALQYGVDSLPFQNEPRSIGIHIDNQELLFAWRKGRSKNFAINQVVQRILTRLSQMNYHPHLYWVPSAANIADALSRVFE